MRVQVRSVVLQDLRVERLGQRGLAPVAEHAIDDVDGRLADRGHDARELGRWRPEPHKSLAEELVHRRGNR